jgi:hypothetical protein
MALSIGGWLIFAFISWYALSLGQEFSTGHVFQVDWHVFWAGAHDLLQRDLYRVPLDAGGLPLSATAFRLPPLSAVWPLPLLPLPVGSGGIVWQVIGAASIAGSAAIALDLAAVRRPWLWAGVVLGPLSVTLMYLEGLHLGTNNYLVLLLVAAGCWSHLRGHDRWAGILIGLAAATKLWPAVLLVVMLRERRWRELRWTAGTLALQGIVLLLWLGPDVVGDMLATLSVASPPTGLLIGPTAFPAVREAWNAGLGVVVCVGLLALPLRGRAGLGAAIVAGMAPIGNLWIHYAPTLLFGLALLAADALRRGDFGGHGVGGHRIGGQGRVAEQPPA